MVCCKELGKRRGMASAFVSCSIRWWCVSMLCIWISQAEAGGLPLPGSGEVPSKSLHESLASITLLPLWSQKVTLKMIGEEYVKRNTTHCNVFGGQEACLTVPDYSDYMRLCNSKNKLVDCMFETMSSQNDPGDPSLVLQQYVGTQDHIDCADCHENFKKFQCALTMPTCGTVDKVLDQILPLLSSVASNKHAAVISLQKALPGILQAASLGFPCKKMCKAVIDSCGCGQQPTFGEVMDSIFIGGQLNMTTTMGLSTNELFQSIWNEDACDLFSEESIPGFSGICVSSDQTSRCNWCNGQKGPKSIHKQVVEHGIAQMAQMVFRLLQGGLEEILIAVSDTGKQGDLHLNQTSLPLPTRKRRGYAGAVVFVVFLLVFIVIAFVITIKASINRQNPTQYIDLGSMGYTAPIL